MNIFTHRDYKDFIRSQIEANTSTYAYKSKLAAAAGCQKSFLSQVLRSHVHLTPDHANGLSNFWNLSSLEREYFMDLVHLARSSSRSLKEYLHRKLEATKRESENLGKRFQQFELNASEQALNYYSSWHFGAIHMLLTIPGNWTITRIATRLQITPELVEFALKTLESLGLIKEEQKKWAAVAKSLHVSNHSPLNTLNHIQWRNRAMNSIFSEQPQDLHYTALYSASRQDIEKLKQAMLAFIDNTRKIVAPSNEEDLIGITCDLFRI